MSDLGLIIEGNGGDVPICLKKTKGYTLWQKICEQMSLNTDFHICLKKTRTCNLWQKICEQMSLKY